jgi:hypothetical protein
MSKFSFVILYSLALVLILSSCKSPKEKLKGEWFSQIIDTTYRISQQGESWTDIDTSSIYLIISDDSITILDYPIKYQSSQKYFASDDSLTVTNRQDTAFSIGYYFRNDSLFWTPNYEGQLNHTSFGKTEFDDNVLAELYEFGFNLNFLKGKWRYPEHRFYFNHNRCDSIGYESLKSFEIINDSTLQVNSKEYPYERSWKGFSSGAFEYQIFEYYKNELQLYLIPKDTTCDPRWLYFKR